MQYMMLIFSREAEMSDQSDPKVQEMAGAFAAYTTALKEAGVLVGGNRLKPVNTATTVRAPQGKRTVLNGPYAETHEQLGGYFIIETPDLDAALAWAARCPASARGAIEVRPVWPM
jgi:hypothetical protein